MPVCDETCLKRERQVLLDMYLSLRGKEWKNSWDIYGGKTVLSNFSHCDWYGILCDNETKHILEINLAHNNINGMLPGNVSNIQFLLSLRIPSCQFQGQLGEIVIAMPKYMMRLSFPYTEVNGVIPTDIANSVPILAKLQLSGSQVSGEIPESIGKLTHLTVLSLGETKIRGSIPGSLSKLRNLWFIDLEALGLKGDLSIFHSLRKLTHMHLSSNRITGTIPLDIGESCPHLKEILLQNNNFIGQLPRSIGMLSQLETMNVAKNKLSGLIPVELFNVSLRVLVLSSNKFIGFEQGSKSYFTDLYIFMAAHLPDFNCSLNTMLSYVIESRKTLMQMDISHSNVYGRLPGWIFSFRRLTFLKLASNKLYGTIPSPWNNLPYLTMLDLENNNLSGHIPISFSRLLMLTQLYLRRNKNLKGPLFPSFLTLDYTLSIKERIRDTCPMVKFAHNHGSVYIDSSYYDRKYCYCAEHYFGNGVFCRKCMYGSFCPGSTKYNLQVKTVGVLAENQEQLSFSSMYLKAGYFPFPSASNVTSIHKCPTSVYHDNICVPRKRCNCFISTKEKDFGTAGRMITVASAAKIECNESCLCLVGHHGRFCSRCKQGYYKEGIRCFQCPMGSMKDIQLAVLFGAAIGSVVISIAVFCISIKSLKLSLALAAVEVVVIFACVLKHFIPVVVLQIVIIIFALGFSRYLQRCTALLKSVIFYLQIIDSLVSTTDVWPKSIYSAQVYISSTLNFCFSSLACSLPNFFTLRAKNFLLFILPMFCIGSIWLVYILWKVIAKPAKEKLLNIKFNCLKYCIVLIDLAYFPMVRSCFSVMIGCKNIDDVSFMKRYVWVDCNSHEHTFLKVIAFLQFILYIIAVPFFIYIPLLFRHRHRLSNNDSPVCKWLSPLITPYKPKYRKYIEVVMLIRRLLIAILMTSFPANSSQQTQCIAILLILAIIFQAITRPFKNPTVVKREEEDSHGLGLENFIEIFMLFCVLLSFLFVGLTVGRKDTSESALFFVTLSINGIFLLTFCCSAVYRLLQLRSSEGDDGNFPDLQEPLINASEDCYLRQPFDYSDFDHFIGCRASQSDQDCDSVSSKEVS